MSPFFRRFSAHPSSTVICRDKDLSIIGDLCRLPARFVNSPSDSRSMPCKIDRSEPVPALTAQMKSRICSGLSLPTLSDEPIQVPGKPKADPIEVYSSICFLSVGVLNDRRTSVCSTTSEQTAPCWLQAGGRNDVRRDNSSDAYTYKELVIQFCVR